MAPALLSLVLLASSVPWEFAAFIAALAFYHVSEFTIAAAYNRDTLSKSSWLFSTQYCAAMSVACAEYWVERAFAPGLKGNRAVRLTGLGMVLAGDGLRKAAEITARHNFTHHIMVRRRPEHRLVKHGVYKYVRHPGYLGWLVWAVGTQVLLCNPVCLVGFAWASWRFFAARVPFEESLLRQMFPEEYPAYAAKTRTWMPGIR